MNDLEQSARSWIDTRTDDKITITLLGQSDNQLKFSVHTCGCGGEPEEPSVWSESPNIQQKLSSVLEFCDSEREKSLEEVLDKMAALLPKRLAKDMKNMKKEAKNFGIDGGPRGDNLFIWPVVYLEMQFPGDYPMSPPFVRVTRPRFKFLTGGSICMQMLTRSGWTPSNDIEIRSEIMSDKNTRLDSNPDRQYTETEAKDAFHRMVKRYQWN
ncbi:U2QL1-like protein [Mya arenaria]|uniref:U2QL1-like protein n=1 Tax=Mya arenaria TaxID=6604 RepID=A0ABY7EUK7_MYAAR|nr:U2QL1-like protein [Mya arenaria]